MASLRVDKNRIEVAIQLLSEVELNSTEQDSATIYNATSNQSLFYCYQAHDFLYREGIKHSLTALAVDVITLNCSEDSIDYFTVRVNDDPAEIFTLKWQHYYIWTGVSFRDVTDDVELSLTMVI